MAAWIGAAALLGIFSVYSSRQEDIEFAKLEQQVSDTHALTARSLNILATKSDANPNAEPDAVVKAAASKIDTLQSEIVALKANLRRRLTHEQATAFKDVLSSLSPSLSANIQIGAFSNCPNCMVYAWDYAIAINDIPAWKKAKEQKVLQIPPESGINPSLEGVIVMAKTPKQSDSTAAIHQALERAGIKYTDACCSAMPFDTLVIIAPAPDVDASR
jgi:hypothetical protein